MKSMCFDLTEITEKVHETFLRLLNSELLSCPSKTKTSNNVLD